MPSYPEKFRLSDWSDINGLNHLEVLSGEPRIISTNGDPYWQYTKSLLYFNGADTSTTITDENSNHTWTAMGDAQIDTAQSQWGGSSLLLDGTGDYVKTENNLTDFDFGSGSWPIEGWFYLNETMGSNVRALFGYGGGYGGWNTTNGHVFIMFVNTDGNTYFQYNSAGAAVSLAWAHTSLSAGFHFIQVQNDTTQNTFKVKIDGTTVYSSVKITISTITSPLRFTVGNIASLDMPWKGWIDDFRVTKGITRSESVPTEAFLNANVTASPTQYGNSRPVGTVIKPSTAKCWVKKNGILRAATDSEFQLQYAFNGGALNGSWLTISQYNALGDTTITTATNSVTIYPKYVTDATGSDVISSDAFISMEVEYPAGGGFFSALID